MLVKGRSVPVEAFSVEGLRETTPATAIVVPPGRDAFVGRAGELALARSCRARAYDGEGQVLVLTGDPGVGKSRLVAQLVSEAAGRGVVTAGAGGAPGDARPYLAWRPIWRSLLLHPGPRPPTPADVEAVVADGSADDRTPLLGAVLGISMPDNAFTASLTPAQRADATRVILLECLRRCCAKGPVTVVIDDAHWLDELSQGLLEHLAAHVADLPVLLVVVAREEPRVADLLTRLRALAHCTSVSLPGLAPEDAERLVGVRAASGSRGEALPPDLVRRIALRGGGNPLFLEQLVTWARDQPGAATTDPSAELPPDVRRLVLARVDRLVPRGQATLKAASVIADAFSAASVQACLAAGTADQVERDLRELESLEILTTDPGGPEATYGFRHALVQEVVYGSLSGASRAELHEAVGEHLERTHAGELPAWVDRLAHHYGRSRNVGKQRTWFRAAGDAAARTYANEAALGYYERLADVLPGGEKAEVLVRIGSIHQLTGRWREAEEVLRATLQTAGTAPHTAGTTPHTAGTTLPPQVAAEAERELGLVLLATRQHGEAVDRLRSAADAFARLDDPRGQAGALDRLAFALFEHGDYRAALEAARLQLAVEESRQDPAGMSAALENNGVVHWRRGEYGTAMPLLRRAYALARRSGDRRLVVHTANDLAGLYAERGDHRRAVRYLQEAITTADHIGYRQATAYLTGNAGELYRDRGDFEEAQRHFSAGLRAAIDIGDWITTVRCTAALAMTAADQGAAGHRDLLRRACDIAGQLHQSYVLADVLLRRAEAAFDDGDATGALPLARQAETAAWRLSERGPTLRPHLLRLRIEVALGRTGAAQASREIAHMLPEWPDPPERALLLDTLARIDPAAQAPAREAAALYRDLYGAAPSLQFATAYRRLTGGGTDLPPATPLPRLAAEVTDGPVDLDHLFTRVERLAAAAPALP